MWISELSIRRPVLAIVMSLIMVILGAVAVTRLSVREYPDIDPPVVSVTTVYAGASPEVIENSITEPLEDELTSIEGVKTLSSSSAEGASNITVVFELDRDVNVAAQDVRDRVFRARGRLPDDIEEPVIVKQDADARPILWIGLSGKGYSQLQLSDYADRYLIDQLQTVPGVGRIFVGGQRQYAMRVWLNPEQMAARNITALDIRDALRDENLELPSGRIESATREFSVRTLGEMVSPEEFRRLLIKTVNGQPVYLQDVAHVDIGARDDRSLVRMNGVTAIGLGIVKQSKANTLDVADRVKAKIETIRQDLPPGMTMKLGSDDSRFIRRSIEEVRDSLLIAVVLVTLVIFLFLGSFRSMIIPVVAIPISLITTFFVMDLLNYSINTLTLLAMTLAIGLVVDDAIVVLENIYRRIEMGETPFQASVRGVREIAFAVLATTAVLVAIFVPLTFLGGTVGRLFSEFAIALAGSVVISAVVALTLSPMMCSKILKPEQSHNVFTSWTAPFRNTVDWVRDRYLGVLEWALGRKKQVLAGTLILMLLTVVSYVLMPKEFLPKEDKSVFLVFIKAPEGSTLAFTDRAFRQAEAILAKVPEVERYFSVISFSMNGPGDVNQGLIFTTLKEKRAGRTRSVDQITQSLFPQFMAIAGADVFPFSPASGPAGMSTQPVEFVLKGFDIHAIADAADRLKEKLSNPTVLFGLYNVDSNLKLNKPQLKVHINRERASDLGVSVRDIAATLQILLGGLDISTFQLNNKRYDVMVQLPGEDRTTPDVLNRIQVRAESDKTNGSVVAVSPPADPLVPLTAMVTVDESVAPREIPHYNRMRSAKLTAGIIPIPGLSLGGLMEKIDALAAETLPNEVTTEWSGEGKELLESQSATMFAFLLSVLMVYLVLAAQFESFVHPMVVILTVPLAVCGAFVTLFLFGGSFNTYSQIGMILLVGLVTKNGILIVEYANALKQANPSWPVAKAVSEASGIRFRPIMMTAVSTIFGAVPLLLGTDAGAASRISLGMTVIGGMILATGLTLFVIPIAYVLFNQNRTMAEPIHLDA